MESTTIKYVIKINLPGGIVPAGELLDILNIATGAGIKNVRFGNRQQLFLEVTLDILDELENHLTMYDVSYEVNKDDYPNIISSYVTEDIVYNSNWVKEGVYKDILDLFDHKPQLKINIVENSQSFVPFFTGNINFISSDVSNFWYLYVRFPKTNNTYCWPSLIYSEDIPAISHLIEIEILRNLEMFYDQPVIDGTLLHKKVDHHKKFLLQPNARALQLPEFHLPFYEGFNKYGDNKLWLGIYRRTELFPIDFLKEMCTLCMETRIGQLYITPWKSLVVKGIDQSDRKAWGSILNRYRINVRHAANELNWQVEDNCEEGLLIKRQLVKEFEEADTRTYRLCFAVQTKPKSGLFGSVIIHKQRGKKGDLFEILHTLDFNPNSKDFVRFKSDIPKEEIGDSLTLLCDQFYGLQEAAGVKSTPPPLELESRSIQTYIYQCKNCMTLYDEIYGDQVNGIEPGIKFEAIESYRCPTCEAPKQDFFLIGTLSAIN